MEKRTHKNNGAANGRKSPSGKTAAGPVVNIRDYMPKRDFSSVWVHFFAIIVLTIAIYSNGMNGVFVGDDISFIKENIAIRSLANIPDFFLSPKSLAAGDTEWGTTIYRPLRTVSFAVDYALFGLQPYGYHAVSLALHLIAAVSFYFVVLGLFNIAGVAFLSALLFAAHPVHIEAVTWIASRADLIGMVLFNVTFLAYMRYKDVRRKGWLAASLALSFLSYMGKETMVFLPGIIILYDYATRNRRPVSDTIKANIVSWVLFTIVCAAYLFIRMSITGRMSQNQGWWGGTAYSNFLMMAEATATYIRLMVVPYGFTFHYIIDPVYSVLAPKVVVSLVVILASIVLIIYSHFRNRLVFFSLVWFYLGLVPIANIIPISFSMMAERYIYVASAGPIIAAGYGLYRLYRYATERSLGLQRLAVGGIVVLVLIFSVQVIIRNDDYKDEFAFYSSAVAVSPDSPPSNKGLADQYYNKKDYAKAIEYYEKAIAADPVYVEALLGEAVAYRETGELAKALAAARKAALVEEKVPSLKPRNPLIKFNLGNIYKEMGDLEAARAEWEAAVELNPEYPEALNHLGIYWQMKEDNAKALSMFERSLKANRYNAETHYNAALIYEALGNREKAGVHFKSFMGLAGPEYAYEVGELKKKGY
ncbi:MAG: tetratricopeptide repeat protein [Deltaproteobacteria bacterium]|nr:tetratricopeptide repeat protein [Deltaproteobacteria bacterium]